MNNWYVLTNLVVHKPTSGPRFFAIETEWTDDLWFAIRGHNVSQNGNGFGANADVDDSM